jgi:hypothetical protein
LTAMPVCPFLSADMLLKGKGSVVWMHL